VSVRVVKQRKRLPDGNNVRRGDTSLFKLGGQGRQQNRNQRIGLRAAAWSAQVWRKAQPRRLSMAGASAVAIYRWCAMAPNLTIAQLR
jgi:hypothetical protein